VFRIAQGNLSTSLISRKKFGRAPRLSNAIGAGHLTFGMAAAGARRLF
jgi:hypothetical protein